MCSRPKRRPLSGVDNESLEARAETFVFDESKCKFLSPDTLVTEPRVWPSGKGLGW